MSGMALSQMAHAVALGKVVHAQFKEVMARPRRAMAASGSTIWKSVSERAIGSGGSGWRGQAAKADVGSMWI